MPLDEYEDSLGQARPLYFYLFTLNGKQWRYVSAQEGITLEIDGHYWEPMPISHNGIKQSGDTVSDALEIECPRSVAPVQLFNLRAPSSMIGVRIFHKDASDNEMATVFVGEVIQINATAPGAAKITCETLSATFKRTGLRLSWQRACPYALYDLNTCKIDKSVYMIQRTITSVNGFLIQLSGANLTSNFIGGFIEWVHPVKGTEFLTIEDINSSQILMFGDTVDLYAGLQIKAYPGCARTPAACQGFNNYDNYGGIPNMPGKSPFDGVDSPVF